VSLKVLNVLLNKIVLKLFSTKKTYYPKYPKYFWANLLEKRELIYMGQKSIKTIRENTQKNETVYLQIEKELFTCKR